jgi:hypothetical protein
MFASNNLRKPALGRRVLSQIGWPRIKAVLDTIMERWIAEHGRVPKLSLTHDGFIGWADKAELLGSEVFGAPLIGREFIGNGKAEETRLIRILRGNIGGFRRMPSRGPYATDAEIAEIAAWIDAGMPD